jgi:hypothetical protein
LGLHAGPVHLAVELGLPSSTTVQVLRRSTAPHLGALHRISGELLRSRATEQRYETRSGRARRSCNVPSVIAPVAA